MVSDEMEVVEVSPKDGENFAFTFLKPADWKMADIPAEEPQFGNPTYFYPMLAAVSGDGAGAFTVGARMAYPDGTLQDWMEFICAQDNITIENRRIFAAGKMRGWLFDGVQRVDGVHMVMRNLYLEDVGRLYAVCAMASVENFDSVAEVLQAMTESFRLKEPEGPSVALMPMPDSMFESQIGLTLMVPGGWMATDQHGAAVVSNSEMGIMIRIDRREIDENLVESLKASYREENPDMETMYNESEGAQMLALANVKVMMNGEETVAYRAYHLYLRPEESVMYVSQATMSGYHFRDALEVNKKVLGCLYPAAAEMAAAG